MRKHIFEVTLALTLSLLCIAGAFATETSSNISSKLIRLHVIANSDSKEDQALKLLVRDSILTAVSDMTKGCRDLTEARVVVSENLDTLRAIALNVINANGFSYDAKAELSTEYFPTKTYDSFALPAGKYEALRIMIGNANGQNWWCVLFPPVCVSAAEAKSEFENAGLSEDEINFVTSDETEYKLKFKIVEIIENIADKF